jgi:hypothetical protein
MLSLIKEFFKKEKIVEREMTKEEVVKDIFVNTDKNSSDLVLDINEVDIKNLSEEEEPSYPPIIDGLKIIEPIELIKRQKSIIAQIRTASGYGIDTNDEFFNKFYLEPIMRYASLVQELPASEYDHHRGAGGLFEHSLEVSLNALKISKGYFLPPIGTVEIEHERKKKWEYAAWLIALLHDAGKPMTMMKIISEKGSSWSSYTTPLYEWAMSESISRYVIVWNDNRKYEDHKRAAVSWFYKIATKEILDYLQSSEDRLIEEITFALTDYSHSQSYLSNIVRKSDSISVQLDFERRVNRILGKKRVSLSTEFINSIRHLKNVSWNNLGYNKPNSMVWVIDGDVYLSWPDSIRIILNELQNRNISVPSDYIQATQILESKRLIVSPSSGGVFVFKPKEYEDVVQLIRLAGPTLYFDGDVLPVSAEGMFTNFELQRKQEAIKKYIENAIEAGEDIDVVSQDLNQRIYRDDKNEINISNKTTVAPKVFSSKMSASEILEAQNEVNSIKKVEENKPLLSDKKDSEQVELILEDDSNNSKTLNGTSIKIKTQKTEDKKPFFKLKSKEETNNQTQENSHQENDKKVVNTKTEIKPEVKDVKKEIKEKAQIVENAKKQHIENNDGVSRINATNKIKNMKEGLMFSNINGVLDPETNLIILEQSTITSKKKAEEYLRSKKQAGAFIKELAEKIKSGHIQRISAEESPVHSTKKISNVPLIILDFEFVCKEIGRASPQSALKALKEYQMIICQSNSIGENCYFDYIVKRENAFKKEKRVLLNQDVSEAILYYAEIKKAEEDKQISDKIEIEDKYSGGIKLNKFTLQFFDLIVNAIKQGKDFKIDIAKSIVWVDTKFIVGFMNENIKDEVLFKTELESNIDKSTTERIAGKQYVYLPEKWMKEVIQHVSKK